MPREPATVKPRLEKAPGPDNPKSARGVLALPSSGFTLNQRGGEQRDHQLVMAGHRESMAARFRVGPLDYVQLRPVMLQKIEVRSGEIRQRMAQVAHHGYRLQEHL